MAGDVKCEVAVCYGEDDPVLIRIQDYRPNLLTNEQRRLIWSLFGIQDATKLCCNSCYERIANMVFAILEEKNLKYSICVLCHREITPHNLGKAWVNSKIKTSYKEPPFGVHNDFFVCDACDDGNLKKDDKPKKPIVITLEDDPPNSSGLEVMDVDLPKEEPANQEASSSAAVNPNVECLMCNRALPYDDYHQHVLQEHFKLPIDDKHMENDNAMVPARSFKAKDGYKYALCRICYLLPQLHSDNGLEMLNKLADVSKLTVERTVDSHPVSATSPSDSETPLLTPITPIPMVGFPIKLEPEASCSEDGDAFNTGIGTDQLTYFSGSSDNWCKICERILDNLSKMFVTYEEKKEHAKVHSRFVHDVKQEVAEMVEKEGKGRKKERKEYDAKIFEECFPATAAERAIAYQLTRELRTIQF